MKLDISKTYGVITHAVRKYLLRADVSADGLSDTLVASEQFFRSFAVIAQKAGMDVSFDEIQRAYPNSKKQLGLNAISAIVGEIGFSMEALSVDWREIASLENSLPALLTMRDGTYLIINGIAPETAHGHLLIAQEAATGDEVIALDEQRFNRLSTGEVILLRRSNRFAATDQPFSFRWIATQMLREKRLVRDIGIASVTMTVFSLSPPLIVMLVLNRVLTNQSFSTLYLAMVGVAVLIAFEVGIGFTRKLFLETLATTIDAKMSIYMSERLLALPLEFFEKNPTGLIQSRLSKMWTIRNFLTGKLLQTFLDCTVLIGLIPVLFILNWALTFFILGLGIIIAIIVAAFMPVIGKAVRQVIIAEVRKNTHLVESIYGIKTIKSLALEGRRRAEWDGLVAAAVSAKYNLGETGNVMQSVTLPFERLIYGGSFLLGAYLTLTVPDTFQAGSLLAFVMLGGRATQPIVQMAHLLLEYGEVQEAVHEVARVVNEPAEALRAGTGLRMPVHGNIIIDHVNFRYSPTASLALDDVSLTIEAGTVVGIMGRSGSGKSTITRLLQGLNAQYEGIIKIDGMDLREMDLTHLRTNIGIVAQENFLFSGTIRDNIGIAKPNASFAEIVRVAQLAGAEEFIERMPKGYDTVLSEGATNLSGGQRQRLAIARALILDPPILILDEATSALDAESEAIINANLFRIAKGRTIVCVSHRLSMLVNADQIVVMEKGSVNGIGTHAELLYQNEIYKHMWYTQNPGGAQAMAMEPAHVL